jgi:multidrug efflux system outer membrane protein
VPASVLERRPDIAAAERLVASRNAEIGVAVAGYFPSVRLTGSGGQLSRDIDSLFSADSRTWSIGPSISLPLTGYALTGARVRHAKAVREEAIAQYRQAVLGAFRDVETSLAQVRRRAEQAEALGQAAAQAAAAAALARHRLDAGIVSRTEWIEAEHARHDADLRRLQSVAMQHVATVRLIKALGGGWDSPGARP